MRANYGLGIARFGNPGQEVASQLDLLKLRIEDCHIKIAFVGVMSVDRDFIDSSTGGDVSRANAVVAEVCKQGSCAGQDASFHTIFVGFCSNVHALILRLSAMHMKQPLDWSKIFHVCRAAVERR